MLKVNLLCEPLFILHIYYIKNFLKNQIFDLAAGLGFEPSHPVLETSALADILTRSIY